MNIVATSSKWLLDHVIVLCLAGIGTYATQHYYKKFKRYAQAKQNILLSIFLEAIHWPLIIYIWFSVLLYALKNNHFIHAYLPHIREKGNQAGFLLFIVLTFVRSIWIIEERYFNKAKPTNTAERTMFQLISKILRAGTILLGIFMVMSLLGMDITLMLTGSTAIIGWAAKDMLADYFGTILIHSEALFKAGDWIVVTAKNVEGIVVYVGWRTTCIRAFDKKLHHIPNNLLIASPLVNASRMTHRRIYETIALRHQDAKLVPKITQAIKQMLHEHPAIARYQRIMIHLTHITAHSLQLHLYAFTRTCDLEAYRNLKQQILLKIIDIITYNGAQLAHPMHSILSTRAATTHKPQVTHAH